MGTHDVITREGMKLSSLEELVTAAETLGKITIFQSDDKTWSAYIKFETIPGTVLKAESGFNHPTMSIALIEAMNNAQKIRNQFK